MDVQTEMIGLHLKYKDLEEGVEQMKVIVKHDLTQLIKLVEKQELEIRNLKLALECYKPSGVDLLEDGVSIYG